MSKMAEGGCAPMEEGGYQYDYVDDPPDSLSCPICLLPCKEPHILDCCGKKFCRSCIDRVKYSGQPCPHCREHFQSLIDREHERKILSLKVYCNYREGGCDWMGELRHIEDHLLKRCHYVPVFCKYECGYKCIRRDIFTHEEDECESRPLELKLIKKVESLERKVVLLEERCTNQDNIIKEQSEMITQQAALLEEQKNAFATQQEVFAASKEEVNGRINVSNERQETIRAQIGNIQETLQLHENEHQQLRNLHVAKLEEVKTNTEQLFEEHKKSHELLKKDLDGLKAEQLETNNKFDENAKAKLVLATEIKANEVTIKQIRDIIKNLQDQVDNQKADLDKKIASLKDEGATQKEDFKELLKEANEGLKRELGNSDIKIKDDLQKVIDKRLTEAKEIFLLKASHDKYVDNLKKMSTGFRIPEWQRPLPLTSFSNVPPCQFTMMHFSRHKEEGKAWYSPPFYSEPGGYKLCLRIDPNGMLEGKESHLSVWVYVMKGRFDDSLKWPFTGKITVQLLNWKADRGHIQNIVSFDDAAGEKVRARVTSGKYAATGRGSSKFVPHAMLPINPAKNTDFSTDDCLCFKISKVDVH